MAKKRESWYVIDEEAGDELTVVEAVSAEAAVRGLFDDIMDDPHMPPFHVTVFRARDAKRFELSPNVDINLNVVEIT